MHVENNLGAARLLRVRDLGIQQPSSPETIGDLSMSRGRFVEPYQFQPKQMASIIKQLKKDGVGNDDERRTYIIALEFEIGAYLQAEPEPSPAPVAAVTPLKRDQGLDEIAQSAQTLSDLLEQAPPTARESLQENLTRSDPFGRPHQAQYLRSLQLEIQRLAEACAVEAEPTPAPVQPPVIITGTARRFIRRLAETYAECFGLEATAQQATPFVNLLELLNQTANLALPLDEQLLAEVLA